jgi:O-antigen/teichoic acid export membrane protein
MWDLRSPTYNMGIKQKTYNLLRWSQKYTKTDMVYLAKGGFWFTFVRVISSSMGILLTIAFANLLPKETYGQYKYILSVASILFIPTLMGMNTAITQAVARGYEGSVISGFKTRLRWGIFSTIGSLGFAGYYYINANFTLSIAFFIISFLLPFSNAFGVYDSYIKGKKLFKISAKYGIATSLISVSIMIAVLSITNNVLFIVLTYYASHTIINCFFFNKIIKNFNLNKKEDPETIPYGKHLSLMSILGVAVQHIDKIIIWHFLGAIEVAIYTMAISPVQQTIDSFGPLGLLAMPKFSNQNKEILKKTIPLKILKSLVFTIPITIIYIITAPFVYKTIFPQYLDSIFYSQIFALAIIFQGSALLGVYFRAQMRIKDLYVINIVTPIIKLALMIIMLPLWGVMGMVIALLSYQILSAILLIFMMKKS